MKDTYTTLSETAIGEYKEKGSKFIAYAYNVTTKGQIKEHLDRLKKEHLKACHYCYAYRLGLGGKDFRTNDDGEPSGTAGRPILGQIDSFGLSDVIIIVVRYYGGTKLGTSGLKTAYKEAARDALAEAATIEKIVKKNYLVEHDYAVTSDVMNYLKKTDFDIINTEYLDKTAIISLQVRLDKIEEFETKIRKIDTIELKEA